MLSLPAELRNNIYELVLVHKSPVIPRFAINKRNCYNTSVLRASKIVYYETVPIFYGQNCFDLLEMKITTIPRFIDTIGHTNASHIRYIRIPFPTLERGPIFMPGLRELWINLCIITMTFESVDDEFFAMYIERHEELTEAKIKSADGFLQACRHHPDVEIKVEVHEHRYIDAVAMMRAVGWDVVTLRPLTWKPDFKLQGWDLDSDGEEEDEDDDTDDEN